MKDVNENCQKCLGWSDLFVSRTEISAPLPLMS